MSDIDVSKLVCYGCANSASGVPFPSHSSGESACGVCIRYRDDQGKFSGWEDGDPAQHPRLQARVLAIKQTCGHYPVDNYKSPDYLQIARAESNVYRERLEELGRKVVSDAVRLVGHAAAAPALAADAEHRLGLTAEGAARDAAAP